MSVLHSESLQLIQVLLQRKGSLCAALWGASPHRILQPELQIINQNKGRPYSQSVGLPYLKERAQENSPSLPRGSQGHFQFKKLMEILLHLLD